MMKLKINEAILKSGLKKKHVAKELSIDPNVLSRYIYGKRKISLEMAVKLAEILDCDLNDLFEQKK